jgi:hypothetical protein
VGEFVQPLTDPSLTGLSEIFDPAALANHLRGVSLGPWNGGAVEEVRVLRVLNHHARKRCALEIGLRTQSGRHFLIGKVYRNDRLDVFQAMKGIQHAGFGPQDEFSIPQPLAYLPSLRLLLQEKVEGPVAKEVFKTGDERIRAAAAERCALWLARFHALAPKAGPVARPNDYLTSKTMRRYSLKIAKLVGRHAKKAAELLQRLKDASESLSAVEMRAGHASYTPRQIILAEGRAVTFDWDGYDVADPARDVARFLAALRRLAVGWLGSVRAMDGTVEVFLNTYLAAGPPEAKKNLRFFAAATYLNLAKHTLCRPGPHKQEKHNIAEAVLDEGLRVLEREATP